jgi:hypothetical protein
MEWLKRFPCRGTFFSGIGITRSKLHPNTKPHRKWFRLTHNEQDFRLKCRPGGLRDRAYPRAPCEHGITSYRIKCYAASNTVRGLTMHAGASSQSPSNASKHGILRVCLTHIILCPRGRILRKVKTFVEYPYIGVEGAACRQRCVNGAAQMRRG